MSQGALLALTATAFFLSTSSQASTRRWGPLVGIPAQSLWVTSVDWSSQWGIGAVTVLYLARYLHLTWTSWGPTSRR